MEFVFELQKFFPNYCIEYVNLPTYIQYFYKTSFKIILVYKSELNNVAFVKKNDYPNSSYVSQLDLTGSPLKTSLYESDENEMFNSKCRHKRWTDDEELHCPVTLEEARKIINKYNTLISNNKTKLGGIWCVCKDDNEDIALLGSDSMKNLFSRNIIKINKFSNGNVEDIESMLSIHEARTKNIFHNVKCQSELKCVYAMSESQGLNSTMEQPFINGLKSNGNIQIEFVANKSGLYSILEDNITSFNLVIQCAIGHYDNEAIMLWQQLESLHKLINILQFHNNDADLDIQKVTLPCVFQNNYENIIDRIEKVFETTEHITRLRQLASKKQLDITNLHQSILNVNMRDNKDFTDMLWDVLSCIQSYTELSNSFQYIFEKIYKNEKNIFVDSKNQTEIARVIRDIKSGRAVITKLTGTRPLQLLVDIGFEKLSKDYKHIFLSSGLASAEQLLLNRNKLEMEFSEDCAQDQISSRSSALGLAMNAELRMSGCSDMQSRKTSFYPNRKTIAPQKQVGINKIGDVNMLNNNLVHLARIQTVVDIISFVNTHFPSSPALLLKVTLEALDTFLQTDSVITSFSHLLENPLHTLTVKLSKNEITLKMPHRTMWRFTLLTENKNRGVTSVFLQTSSPIFPMPFDSSQECVKKENDEESNEQYYSYELSNIWTKIGV